MPPLPEGAEIWIGFLHSAGTATATGMGLVGLSWCEIEAWTRCTDMVGIATPKDLKMIHTLSRVYANECAAASQKGARAPYDEVITSDNREERKAAVSNTIDNMVASLLAQSTKK